MPVETQSQREARLDRQRVRAAEAQVASTEGLVDSVLAEVNQLLAVRGIELRFRRNGTDLVTND